MAEMYFFSSRGRHTRYWRDWSSDVCSADLFSAERDHHAAAERQEVLPVADTQRSEAGIDEVPHAGRAETDVEPGIGLEELMRSEERREGKECRSRGAPYH